jgi:hypothetical protein
MIQEQRRNDMNMRQLIFDGTDLWRWVEETPGRFWYEFDEKEAAKVAKARRDEAARKAKADGYGVKKFSMRNQSIRRGGIGSPYPEIDAVVHCYGVNVFEKEETA